MLQKTTGIKPVAEEQHQKFVHRVITQQYKLASRRVPPETTAVVPGNEPDEETEIPNFIAGVDAGLDWSPDAARVQKLVADGVFQLKSFGPKTIMAQFRTVRLSDMKITHIDPAFTSLKHLEHLSLSERSSALCVSSIVEDAFSLARNCWARQHLWEPSGIGRQLRTTLCGIIG